jgi:hypothetical protein
LGRDGFVTLAQRGPGDATLSFCLDVRVDAPLMRRAACFIVETGGGMRGHTLPLPLTVADAPPAETWFEASIDAASGATRVCAESTPQPRCIDVPSESDEEPPSAELSADGKTMVTVMPHGSRSRVWIHDVASQRVIATIEARHEAHGRFAGGLVVVRDCMKEATALDANFQAELNCRARFFDPVSGTSLGKRAARSWTSPVYLHVSEDVWVDVDEAGRDVTWFRLPGGRAIARWALETALVHPGDGFLSPLRPAGIVRVDATLMGIVYAGAHAVGKPEATVGGSVVVIDLLKRAEARRLEVGGCFGPAHE